MLPELRPHQLNLDTVVSPDDRFMVDGPSRGTRVLDPFSFALEILRFGGDSVYLRADVVNALFAALNSRVKISEAQAISAAANAGLAGSRAAEAEDAAEGAVALAQAAIAAANGFEIAKYLGEIAALDANPGLAATYVGAWWSVTIEGTLTHASVAGIAVKVGDRLLSNGTAWQPWRPAPSQMTPGSVFWWMFEKRIRDLLAPLNHPQWACSLGDAQGKQALGIDHSGRLHALIAHAAGSIATAALADLAVTREKLAAEVSEAIAVPLNNPTWAYSIGDLGGKMGLGIRRDGGVVGRFIHAAGSIQGVAIADETITRTKLSEALQQGLPEEVTAPVQEALAWVDQATRIALRIFKDGSVGISRLRLKPGSVVGNAITPETLEASRFDKALQRAALSGPGDMIPGEFDGLRRGVTTTVCAGTDPQAGELPVRFPFHRTPVVYGVNDTGTALEFSRAPFFVLRGTNGRGNWAAGASAPAVTAAEGDWWTATGSGTFEGVAYTAGDRIHCIGNTRQSASIVPRFVKAKAGEFFHRGEFTPASFTPSSPADGEHWIADASGTYSGMTFGVGDSLLRVGGAWLPVAREGVQTVAAGAAWAFRVANADDLQVRRADKSDTPVNVTGTAYTTPAQRRTSDRIIFRGDSMVAGGNLDDQIAALVSPRGLTAFSWAAANSEQVLTSVVRDIAAGDPYRGWFNLWFMGTNDSYDLPKISRGVLRALRLSGAADGRCLFLTPIGQWNMSFVGGRIVHFTQEEITAGTHAGSAVNRWFAATLPGRHINSLAALIAGASDTVPSLHHPGMTEKVAAQTYGAAPSSAFYNFAALGFQPADLTFTGYHATAGLPTGGADGDYKIRTGNGSIGLLIVRIATVWTEYPVDITHLSPAGAAILARAVADFLNANML